MFSLQITSIFPSDQSAVAFVILQILFKQDFLGDLKSTHFPAPGSSGCRFIVSAAFCFVLFSFMPLCLCPYPLYSVPSRLILKVIFLMNPVLFNFLSLSLSHLSDENPSRAPSCFHKIATVLTTGGEADMLLIHFPSS